MSRDEYMGKSTIRPLSRKTPQFGVASIPPPVMEFLGVIPGRDSVDWIYNPEWKVVYPRKKSVVAIPSDDSSME